MNEKEIFEKSIQAILKVFPHIYAIYVFGSFGTQYETAQSDLDLAVLSSETLDTVQLWQLAQEVAREIRRDVEIVDLKEASTVFKFQVLTTGKRIYCQDEKKCDCIENVYLSMYLRLNEERAGIIEDKLKRKI